MTKEDLLRFKMQLEAKITEGQQHILRCLPGPACTQASLLIAVLSVMKHQAALRETA